MMLPRNYGSVYLYRAYFKLRREIRKHEEHMKADFFHPARAWALSAMRAELQWRRLEKEAFGNVEVRKPPEGTCRTCGLPEGSGYCPRFQRTDEDPRHD